MSGNRKTILKAFGSQTIVTMLFGGLQVINFSVMSRLLSKEDFGLYAVAASIPLIFTSISEAGLGASIIHKKSPSDNYISTVFSLSFFIGLFFSILLFICASFLSQSLLSSDILTYPIRILSITVFTNCMLSVVRALYVKELNFLSYGKHQIISYATSTLVGVYLAYIGYGYYAMIWATIVYNCLVTLSLYISVNFKFHFCITVSKIKEIVSYGGWLTGSVIVRTINDQMNTLIMPKFMSVTLLGTYNRPANLGIIISNQVNGVFDTILFPILSNIQNDKEQVKSAYVKIFSLLSLFTWVLATLVILSSDILVTIFLGNKWTDLIPILEIIAVSMIFTSFGKMCDTFLRSLGLVKSYFFIRLIMSIFTVICVIIGCQFDLYGVAFAFVVAKMIDWVIKQVYLNHKIGCNFLNFFLRAIRADIFPVLFFVPLYVIKVYIYNSVWLCAFFYVISLSLLPYFFPKIYGKDFYEQIYIGALLSLKRRH